MKIINLNTLKYIEITEKQAAAIEQVIADRDEIDRDVDGDLCCSPNAYNRALKILTANKGKSKILTYNNLLNNH